MRIWQNPGLKNKKVETILNRLRMGHAFTAHNHLVARNDPPVCESCEMEYTVNRIFTECLNFKDARNKHRTPHLLGETIQPDRRSNINIINF